MPASCVLKRMLALVHSLDSVKEETKKVAWTKSHNTFPANPGTGGGEGEDGRVVIVIVLALKLTL